MLDIIKIVRISMKKSFKRLKENSPVFCTILNKDIKVTNTYFKHINWYAKHRKLKEIIIRLSIINLIDDILKNWILSEKRNEECFVYYEIQYEINWKVFCLVLSKNKKSAEIILFSWFVKNK